MATDEQEAVIHTETDRLMVSAFAGCGKTYTLCGFSEHRQKKRFLYLAFNKAIQLEARQRMGRNVDVFTGHGLAFQNVGNRYKHKLVDNLYPVMLLEHVPPQYKVSASEKYMFCLQTIKTINSFHQGFEKTILRKHLPYADGEAVGSSEWMHKIHHFANYCWSLMCKLNDTKIGMTHDGYLKLFQIMKPQLDYDYILFDECQDANPVMIDIVETQRSKIVYVGDEHQQIYAFRGAVNAMKIINPTRSLSLTSSFRFGNNVARIANKLLSEFKSETRSVKGLGGEDRLGIIPEGSVYTEISRSNNAVFFGALKALKNRRRPFFVGGIEGYGFDAFTDGLNLREHIPVQSQILSGFESFEHLRETALEIEDPKLQSIVKIVDTYGASITRMVDLLYKMQAFKIGNAGVVLTTAHKSKGLEFQNVLLSNDFDDLDVNLETDDNEINLWYVAATRCEKLLQPSEKLKIFMFS